MARPTVAPPTVDQLHFAFGKLPYLIGFAKVFHILLFSYVSFCFGVVIVKIPISSLPYILSYPACQWIKGLANLTKKLHAFRNDRLWPL
jgi:hypothetical protein